MEVTVWCPSCTQKYMVSVEYLDKQFRCKKCSEAFRVRDATKAPSAEPSRTRLPTPVPSVDPSPYVDKSPYDDQPLQSIKEPALHPIEVVQGSVLEPLSVGPANGGTPDISPSLFPTSVAAPAHDYGGYEQPSQPSRHVTSALMVPAILAAIFIPLILGGICFGIYTVRTVRTIATANAERRQLAAEERAAQKAERANRAEAQRPIPVNWNRRGPNRNEAAFAELEAERARLAKADAEERKADALKRIARLKAERETRAREREARDKARQVEKARLIRLESEADANPLDGLVAKVKTDVWGVRGMAISNDQMLYAVTYKKILAYDCKRKRTVSTLESLESIDRFSAMGLSSDGSILAVGGQGGEIELIEVSGRGKLKQLRSITEHQAAITRLAFSSDGTRLMSYDKKGKACIWDIGKKAYLSRVDIDGKLLTFFEDPEQNTITLASAKQWTTISFATGKELESGKFPFYMSRISAYIADGSRMVGVRGSGLAVWKLDEKQELFQLKSNGTRWTIVNSNEDEFLVGGNKHFYKFNWKTKELIKVWSTPGVSYVQKIVVSPDDSLAAVSDGPGKGDIYVFELDKN